MHEESSLLISYQADDDEEDEGSKRERQPACPWPDAAIVELIDIVGSRKVNGKFAKMAATTEMRKEIQGTADPEKQGQGRSECHRICS
jgi:hypothetical protein